MRTPRLLSALLVSCLLAVTTQAGAQARDARIPAHATTVALGLGGGPVGLAIGGELSHRRGAHDLTLRGIGTGQIELFASKTRSVGETALLYGLHPLSDRSVLAVRAGPGAVWYSVDKNGSTISTPLVRDGPRLGLAYEVSLIGPVSRVFGIGLTYLGNANSLKSYHVLLLTLHVGRLRNGPL
jgi:hypothetical protein